MDITLFMFFVAFALSLSVLSYLLRGNLGLGLAFIAAGLFIIIGISIGNGELVTTTVYSTDLSNKTTQIYNLGLSATNIMIFFILLGILNIMTAVAD